MMNIRGIGTQNSINMYNVNSRKNVYQAANMQKNDSIEISDAAKILRTYDASELKIDNSEKIQRIKEQLANGTYNVDAKLTAESIMKAINEGKDINDK